MLWICAKCQRNSRLIMCYCNMIFETKVQCYSVSVYLWERPDALQLDLAMPRKSTKWKWRRQQMKYRFFFWNGLFACHYNHMVVKYRKTHDCVEKKRGHHNDFITQCFAIVIYLCDSKYRSRHFDPAIFYTFTFISRKCNYFNAINAIHFVIVKAIQRPRPILPFKLLSYFLKLPN